MAKLTPNVPFITKEPVLQVENEFRLGQMLRFRLRVIDDEGNISEPDEVTVRVGRVLDLRLHDLRLPLEPIQPIDTPFPLIPRDNPSD